MSDIFQIQYEWNNPLNGEKSTYSADAQLVDTNKRIFRISNSRPKGGVHNNSTLSISIMPYPNRNNYPILYWVNAEINETRHDDQSLEQVLGNAILNEVGYRGVLNL